ncbi:hypothetical protein K457DRAFT_133349 [Linnemannia elongata AG-77]|uniref:Uncharacterized protein n=1 Tax=Linnemannia elongata AG-77 TaxID=1314771 RepID=A0A197KEW3_9FUNG|nr:hypothetical protein K457DRAFT_133349 [Linnemannia elongata AG-77]
MSPINNQRWSRFSRTIAQQWPRYSVGAFATWGLIDSVSALWLGISISSFVNNRKFLGGALHHNNETNMGPEEEDRMIKASLIIFGALFALTNAVALYGAVRRSVAATKASLIIWIIQMSWWAVAMVFMVIGFMGLPDSDRDQIPRPSGGDMAVLAGSVWLTLFHGWSLLVYLRDLRSRQRNVWGFLVKPGVQGVFEYEPLGTSSGPVHL